MSAPAALRDARASDADRIAAVYAPLVRETSISFELEPPDAEEVAHRIAEAQARHAWCVAEADGRVLGWASAGRWRGRAAYHWTAETAVYVAAEARGAGLGRRLGAHLLERLAGLGYRSVVAGVTLPNDPSRALHRSLGYAAVGAVERAGWKFGRWWAVEFWTRPIGDGPPIGPPGPDPTR